MAVISEELNVNWRRLCDILPGFAMETVNISQRSIQAGILEEWSQLHENPEELASGFEQLCSDIYERESHIERDFLKSLGDEYMTYSNTRFRQEVDAKVQRGIAANAKRMLADDVSFDYSRSVGVEKGLENEHQQEVHTEVQVHDVPLSEEQESRHDHLMSRFGREDVSNDDTLKNEEDFVGGSRYGKKFN